MTSLHEQAATLADNLDKLAPHDRMFAESLLRDLRTRGLSPRQEPWLGRLIERATGANPNAATLAGDGFKRIAELFATASAHGLRRPRIAVHIGAHDLTLSLAPATGRNPNAIYVKDAGAYAGKVSPAGEWTPARDASPTLSAAVAEFACDPAKAASAHGRLTGNCCFCRKELTDARSAAVGYGATCAKHYGLPWGEDAADTASLFKRSA